MLPIAQIIHLSWSVYTSKFKKYLPLVAIIFASSAVSSFLDFLLSEILKVSDLSYIIYTTLISLVFYIINLAVTIFLIFYTDRLIDNKKIDFKINDVLAIYLPALSVSLLVGLITIGGFLLVIIPGILFTVWYAFAVFEAILNKQKGWAAFRASHDLSKGRFWAIFGRVIVPNIFWGIVAYLVLAGISNLLELALNQPINSSEAGLPIIISTFLISDLIASFFAPLSLIALTIAYREAKK